MNLSKRHRWLVVAAALSIASAVGVGFELCVFGNHCAATPQASPPAGSANATAPAAGVSAATAEKTIGWIDTPADEAVVANELYTSGWALDAKGVRAVELKLDEQVLPVQYGLARPDVSKLYPNYPKASEAGWEYRGRAIAFPTMRNPFEVLVTSADGTTTTLGKRSIIPPDALALWSSESAKASAQSTFYFLMATSGITHGGAIGIDDTYRAYVSSTQRIGVAVPVLYMRTTRGRSGDWMFDPQFDLARKCGERPIADDALDGVLQYAIDKALPVQLVLNGGIWADATCDTPEWDLNDHLEQDPKNCQWSQDNKVFPDDYLKNLAGSTASPELARSLTYNIYASSVRAYKKRNLQAAAKRIAEFARSHPDLFVGVNLDSDTYINPFFEEREWFDYNPDTLRQFRDWLRGSGAYAGRERPPLPDLRAFRRDKLLTLPEVNRLARRSWKSWDEVDPPRRFPGSEHQPLQPGETPFYEDAWVAEWDAFRKHLVALHYSELAQWTSEAGIAPDRIFTSQGFVAPEGRAKPFAIYIKSRGQNYDSGGVSVEGAIPRNGRGHLGTILYGPAAENHALMADRFGLFSTFSRMDPGWAIVESNVADLKHPQIAPQYEQSYRAFRDMFNYDAHQVSLMAWNGSNGIFVNKPGYVSYTSWRNTPAEEAMRDHLVSHAGIPRGARLWTFGTAQHRDSDQWSADDATIEPGYGNIRIQGRDVQIALMSPTDQVIRQHNAGILVIGFADASQLDSIEISGQSAPDAPWQSLGTAKADAMEQSPAGLRMPLAWRWPPPAIVERLKIVITQKSARNALTIRRIALLPRSVSR